MKMELSSSSCPYLKKEVGDVPEILIVSNRDPEPLNLQAFIDLAYFVLELENAPDASEVSIALVGKNEITKLNEQYRSKKGPTDVLSFPCDSVDTIVEEGEPIALGDVIVAPEVAEEQALELGHTVEEELNLLVVHGVLHLLGYDHIEDDEAHVMREREVSILAAWNIRA